jgi:hypothetical protein
MNEKHGFDSFLWHESRAPPTLPQYDIHRLGWGLIDTLFGDDRIEETDLHWSQGFTRVCQMTQTVVAGMQERGVSN